ncbi:phosphoheptose isomerase 1 [Thiosulfatimonas sediminis]|uniref:Phosphoheptose isomerase 1 n=1 Tax=Thiosulfatimonas sediminis TaxID=2675054 RepID=A0A6F8PXA9_9GAMM|nr:SIS domain-containing protein [Thiosulfatimonas sediminis]BBP46628.1 phosphoheptose isomerase 1 [Thiosulfatimonas sediminis]
MSLNLDFSDIAKQHQQAVDSVFAQEPQIRQAAELIIHALQNGNKIMWCGNGGSAAEAQHMAAELMVRYVKNRRPLASIALTNDTSILTAHPNDYEFATLFARQVEGLGQQGDVLIGMSTSGRSSNIINALRSAQLKGIHTVALIGQDDSAIQDVADKIIKVDSAITARIQEGHTLINHLICELLDLAFD